MQMNGVHYKSDNISSPVTNETTIHVMPVLSVLFWWTNELIDVKGAFLCGNFQDEKPIYMKVLEWSEKFYHGNVLLLILQTIYRIKQDGRAFWCTLTLALKVMR